jgi:polyphenol oxidase
MGFTKRPETPPTLQRRVSADGVAYYVSPLLERAGVPHAFSTRIGGVSPPPFDSFNLGNPNGAEVQDEPGRIARHYSMLQAAIGCGDRQRCFAHQVHGDAIAVARLGEPFDCDCKADALVTDDVTRVLAIRTADCIPILLATGDGRAVAAVHAGWRGLVSEVIRNAIQSLRARHPSMRVQKIIAAVGPCIGFDAFDVGNEVVRAFADVIDEDELPAYMKRNHRTGKALVDLRGVAWRLLLGEGVESIDMTDRCTVTHADEFYSHRRDRGVTGRMAAVIGCRAAPP